MRVVDLLGQEAIDALYRPTAEAWGLPGRAYHSAEFLELERETLFSRSWTAAAMASQIPGPGDVLPVDVAGWPLVFARDREGMVRCFHNICRHRGAAVVPAVASDQHALRCPWHAWTYALDGSLSGTPEFGGVGCHETEGFDRASSGLIPVRVAQWFDFLFVNLDGSAPPLDEFLAPLRERFGSLEFSRLKPADDWTSSYPGNWKIAVEGAIEDYQPAVAAPGDHRRPEARRCVTG